MIFRVKCEIVDGSKSLKRSKNGLAYANFAALKSSYLNITPLVTVKVTGVGECGKLCVDHSSCFLACSKRSDSGERCGVEKAMKSRGGLRREILLPRFYFFALPFTLHRSPLSERLEQATCFSANVAAYFLHKEGGILCELLPSDKYNNSHKFVFSSMFNHLSIKVANDILT